MRHWENFDIRTIPHWKIVFVLTSVPNYEMERIMLAIDHPGVEDCLLVHGWHCSCHAFEDTEWDATVYRHDELVTVLRGWTEQGDELEQEAAPLILAKLRGW